MFEKYEEYLNCLDKKLSSFFAKQKEYIRCHKGCCLCCMNINPPFSKLEFDYLQEGVNRLEKPLSDIVKQNIKNIKQFACADIKKLRYNCPFLIDNACSVYKYRGILCRSFGLVFTDINGNLCAPFCSNKGLNYASVFDKEKKIFSEEKYIKFGYENKPIAFNVDYRHLTGTEIEQEFDIKFGETKPLIKWFD